jgi:hypothetical protein
MRLERVLGEGDRLEVVEGFNPQGGQTPLRVVEGFNLQGGQTPLRVVEGFAA